MTSNTAPASLDAAAAELHANQAGAAFDDHTAACAMHMVMAIAEEHDRSGYTPTTAELVEQARNLFDACCAC